MTIETTPPPPKKTTLADVRRALLAAKKSCDFAESVTARAGWRATELRDAVAILGNQIPEKLQAALREEVEEIRKLAWESHNNSPSYRLFQLKNLLAPESKR